MNVRNVAIVPCYNVGPACKPVISEILRYVPECVAIDDGSTDKTASILQDLKEPGLKLLRHQKNLGKGAALITGFRYSLESYAELDSVISLDGDGQHDPRLIPAFIEKRQQERCELVYGNRMSDLKGMPPHRQWLNTLSNRLVSNICKRRIYDSQCGFRLYSRQLLQDMLDELKSGHYELETEILIRTCRKNLNISAIPVSTIYSPETSALSHHSLTDVLRIGKLLLSFWHSDGH